MTWQPLDCHAHTTFSDGALTVDQLIDRARARGVRPSVADHCSHDVARSLKHVDEVRRYLDALEDCDVLRAGEFCWHDTLWREMPPDLVRRMTHRIGSLHAIVLDNGYHVHAFARRMPSGLTAEAYMDAHLANAARFAREMPVDILAHPTLIAMPFRSRAEELWTEEREERLVRALAAAGIGFEVSNRYRPHERLVRRAHAAGVRLSLGSDGHTAEQVADVAFPLALTRRLGVPDEELYDPAVHGSRTGYYAASVRA